MAQEEQNLDLNANWGSISFKIYELLMMRRCLDNLEIFEIILNKQGETLESVENIKTERLKLDKILDNYNLQNPYALVKKRRMTLKIGEWKVLQNGLCVTIGMQQGIKEGIFPKELQFSEDLLKVVKKLHRRFELFPVRILAGLKAKGYRVCEEKAQQIIEEYRTHDYATAIKPLQNKTVLM